jgi:hypothetical protein
VKDLRLSKVFSINQESIDIDVRDHTRILWFSIGIVSGQ